MDKLTLKSIRISTGPRMATPTLKRMEKWQEFSSYTATVMETEERRMNRPREQSPEPRNRPRQTCPRDLLQDAKGIRGGRSLSDKRCRSVASTVYFHPQGNTWPPCGGRGCPALPISGTRAGGFAPSPGKLSRCLHRLLWGAPEPGQAGPLFSLQLRH